MHNTPVLPADLLKKYDTQASSYTTYPTASQFHKNFDVSHFERHSTLSNASLLPKDLSIYVHLPSCHSLDDGGSNKVTSGAGTQVDTHTDTHTDTMTRTKANARKLNNYLERLLCEIAMRGKLFSDDRLVTHIHFGGAIRKTLSTEKLASILDQIALQFHLDVPSNLEISIELDPRYTSPLEIKCLAECGINRFDINVRSFSNTVPQANNPEELTLAAIEAAMHLAKSVNVNLITSLPIHHLAGFEETLSRVIDTGVTRVAAYDLADSPNPIMLPQMIYGTAQNDTKTRLALSSLVRSKLLDANYKHIGMGYYALQNDSLAMAQNRGELRRNFQGYTAHSDNDLIGVGASAVSKLDTAFSQNQSTLSLYSELIDDKRLPIGKGIELSNDDRIRADVIEQIMCRVEVDLSTKLSQFTDSNNHTPLFEYLKRELLELKSFEQYGLVSFNDQGFEITETGRYFMRPIAAVFDRYSNPMFDRHILPFSRKL
ncbi:MAG: oxygen-independent coproporphyrinogen-3 oxidase [Arenicella sp.]|jgi:oxygen-independent coproporphyrinogen-3 oxidase